MGDVGVDEGNQVGEVVHGQKWRRGVNLVEKSVVVVIC